MPSEAQPPQLRGSVWKTVHCPSHSTLPVMQMQVLSEQTCPARHALPQPPQLRRSLVKSAQPAPQALVPGLHTTPNWGQPLSTTTTTAEQPNVRNMITTSFRARRPT
jgi:hypothetical protein